MSRVCGVCLPLVVGLAALVTTACSEASRLKASCLRGDNASCTRLGDIYANGDGVPRDLWRAAEMYRQACDRGAVDVCNTLGEIYERGTDLEGGVQLAEEMFRRACSGGNAAGCTNLGIALMAREDKKTAVALFEHACTTWTPACHHLALAYENGSGVLQDIPRAVGLYEAACETKFVDSCLAVGGLFMAGERVERDAARAARYYGVALKVFDESCEAGHANDCTERDRLRVRITVLTGGVH